MNAIISHNFGEAQQVLQNFSTSQNFEKIAQAATWIVESLRNDGKVLSCGNGGSMCDAMHFAEEMTGRFRKNRPALAAMAISDASHISCVANDYGYEYIFSRVVESVGRKGDVLLALSTSGNSQNIIKAVQAAREKGIKTIVLSGKDGGELAQLAHLEIRVAHMGYADRIQEIHIKIIHTLIQLVEQELYPEYCK